MRLPAALGLAALLAAWAAAPPDHEPAAEAPGVAPAAEDRLVPEPIAPFDLPAAAEPVVRRGDFRRRVLLSGELQAAHSTQLVVPRTRTWGVQIRWLIDHGTVVEPGDLLVEFDSSALASRLADLELSAVEAAEQLAHTRLETEAAEAEKNLAVERARIELDKARIEAGVPQGILARHEYQDRQLALRRAQVEHDKALEELGAHRRTTGADIAIQRLALEKAERRIALVERDLEALRLRAPESGLALVERHGWEDRKVSVGDTVWPGTPLVSLPDLSSLEVEAWLMDVDDGRVEAGSPARCRLDAYPEEAYACRVEEIGPIAQARSSESLRRGFRVRVALARTDGARMRPGMSVAIEIEGDRREGVLLAPRAALDLTTDPPRALLRGRGDTEVVLGGCNAFDCVVESGLEEGRRLREPGEAGP